MLLSGGGKVKITRLVESEAGDLALGCAVENEAFALWGDPVYEAATVGPGDEVALHIERENANVRLVTLEEKRVLPVGSHTKYFSVITGRDVEIAGVIESEGPNVFGLGIEKDGGLPVAAIDGGGTGVSPVLFACG